MKINCKREDFLESIQVVQNALTSTALPVLSYVLLEAGPEKITLTATNLETTILGLLSLLRLRGKVRYVFPAISFSIS